MAFSDYIKPINTQLAMLLAGTEEDATALPGLPVSSTTAGVSGKAGGTTKVHEPAANTAAVVTLGAGGAGVSNVLGMVAWSYDGAPTGGSLTVQDGANTWFKIDITAAGPGFIPFSMLPLKGTANTAMVVTLAAGGAGVSGIVNAHSWTE